MTTTLSPDNHYAAAVKWLDTESFAYFVTDILNMGRPVWDGSIPTACVSVPKDVSDLSNFQFRFNPDFARTLTEAQLAFVAAHETLHIVLNHLALAPKYDDPKLFNVAADCVINDWLAQQGFDLPEWVLRGEKQVGYDCANSTVAEVYGVLQQKQNAGEDTEPGEPGEAGEDGQGGLVDSHDWIHDASAEQQQAAEAAGDKAEQNGSVPQEVKDTKTDTSQPSYGVGSGDGGEGRSFFRDGSVTMKWDALIRRINPDAFRRHAPAPTWYRQPRRLGDSNIMLPEYDATNPYASGAAEQPALVIALDTSGSIQDEDARRFVNLAKSVPQSKVKLFPMTFTTEARELDLENPQYVGGGTEFGCIETYIQDNVVPKLRHYPKAVVVITDGQACFSSAHVAEKHRRNWTWLYCRGENFFDRYRKMEDGPSFGEAFDLAEFTN